MVLGGGEGWKEGERIPERERERDRDCDGETEICYLEENGGVLLNITLPCIPRTSQVR